MDSETVEAIMQAIKQPAPILFGETGEQAERGIVVTPDGYQVHDLTRLLPKPQRTVQSVVLHSPESFADYANRFGLTGRTIVYADEPDRTYTAVINHAAPGDEPGQNDHLATYECPLSTNWTTWCQASGRAMDQDTFAKFLEVNAVDIIEPQAAVLLQLAMNLDIHKSAKFESAIRLDNGQRQFRYIEEVRGQQSAGDIQIPDTIKINVPVFLEGNLYDVLARFRYQLRDGSLRMWYELVRPEDVLRNATRDVTAKIKTRITAHPLLLGNWPS